MNLATLIKKHIRETGDISFAEYMQQALYAPQYGYYTSLLPKFGIAGDFVTAPEISHLFGYTLAKQIKEVFNILESPSILEFGAGTGRLCVDVLTALEKQKSLPESYYILDVSGALKKTQEELILKEIPHLSGIIKWLDTLPSQNFSGVIIANEVLDAMPVSKFLHKQNGIYESFVSVDENDCLYETFKLCDKQEIVTQIEDKFPKDIYPYESEINLNIPFWISSCSDILKEGALFIIDYGFPQHEYYHPDRVKGTIMCHTKHKSHDNPFMTPGLIDITSHVDFTAVADAAHMHGFHVNGYTNQASFLLANDILQHIDGGGQNKNEIEAITAVKKLIEPHEMGELFKVIALTKAIDFQLQGFLLNDKRASL